MSTIEDLPESLLLHILSFLPVKERCVSGGVCKKWRRVTNDKSLWRHVDLMPYKLNLKKTWKLIRSHLSDILLSIKFRGFLEATGTKWKASTVSGAVFEDLQSRCPNVKELVLYNTCIDNVDSSKLPSTLTSLTLDGCSWTKGWLKNARLPNLRSLSLDRTTRVDNGEMEDVVKFTTITSLSLRGCYRIGERSVRLISENLTNLVCLDLSDNGCTDLSMHFISRNMKCLNKLSLASCKHLTNEAVAVLAPGLQNLEFFDITRCPKIDEACVGSLLKMKNMKKLCHTMELNEDSKQRLELKCVLVESSD